MSKDLHKGSAYQSKRCRALRAAACALAFAFTVIVPSLAQSNRARVAVIFGTKGPYRTSANALAAELKAAGHDCTLIELREGDPAARQQALKQAADLEPAVVAAAGPTATTLALKGIPKAPIVSFMVPNALDMSFLADNYPSRERIACLASDIDPAEQVAWILRTYSRSKRIAVLCSPHSRRTAAALEKAGRKRGIVLKAVQADRNEFPKAIETLNKDKYDGVLMIPDARVYNSPNVQRLLLWGVRQKKPVWTFSPNVVKAGAFSGLYCDSAAVGKQAAQIVEEVIRGKAPARIGLHYPRSVGRAVNIHTAETIDVSVDGRVFNSHVVRMGK